MQKLKYYQTQKWGLLFQCWASTALKDCSFCISWSIFW